MGRTNEKQSKIVISTESKEEADKLFNGLFSVGGEVEGPIGDSPGALTLVASEREVRYRMDCGGV